MIAYSHFFVPFVGFCSKPGFETEANEANEEGCKLWRMGSWPSLRKCFLVLRRMKQRNLHFDPQLAQVYQRLAGLFGG